MQGARNANLAETMLWIKHNVRDRSLAAHRRFLTANLTHEAFEGWSSAVQTHPLPALLVVGSSLAAQQQAESKDIVEVGNAVGCLP